MEGPAFDLKQASFGTPGPSLTYLALLGTLMRISRPTAQVTESGSTLIGNLRVLFIL